MSTRTDSLFPYTTRFRSRLSDGDRRRKAADDHGRVEPVGRARRASRKPQGWRPDEDVADSKADGRQGPVRDVRARRKACDAVWAGPEGEARRHGAARPEAGEIGRAHA